MFTNTSVYWFRDCKIQNLECLKYYIDSFTAGPRPISDIIGNNKICSLSLTFCLNE